MNNGVRCRTSSWRRVEDTGIPARAKVTGIYVNSALAKTEAQLDGYDEAILLNENGHVCEGSGENIFLVANGKLLTPPESANILVGITRDTIRILAETELDMEVLEREIGRSEIYAADECFMVGTAAHVTPVVEVDHRSVGVGVPGPVTTQLRDLYIDVIKARNPKYAHWCTPCYSKIKA